MDINQGWLWLAGLLLIVLAIKEIAERLGFVDWIINSGASAGEAVVNLARRLLGR